MQPLGTFKVEMREMTLWKCVDQADLQENRITLRKYAAEEEDLIILVTKVLPRAGVFKRCIIASITIGSTRESIIGFPLVTLTPDQWELAYTTELSSNEFFLPDKDPVESGQWGANILYATYAEARPN